MRRRLRTKDLLRKWGIPVAETCLLCKEEPETADYLFFDCPFLQLYELQFWHEKNGKKEYYSGRKSGNGWINTHEKIFMLPRRSNNQNTQDDEVRLTYGMQTHNRAHTPEPVPTLRVPPVLASPPRAPRININRPQSSQRDISNEKFR
ncbi:uncharacterized protein LOC124888835 [Capsicum annuum]|uniref:uncharacterized protein LOC124888835 n=1 Tax=Capsicum annuum TaxID=4072 RepID=UPI001FB11F74|nr:uncharacterized protein LOC124888835 [Capsicum annuum]